MTDHHCAYQERAAILEYEANLSRSEAEYCAAAMHPPCERCRAETVQPTQTATIDPRKRT